MQSGGKLSELLVSFDRLKQTPCQAQEQKSLAHRGACWSKDCASCHRPSTKANCSERPETRAMALPNSCSNLTLPPSAHPTPQVPTIARSKTQMGREAIRPTHLVHQASDLAAQHRQRRARSSHRTSRPFRPQAPPWAWGASRSLGPPRSCDALRTWLPLGSPHTGGSPGPRFARLPRRPRSSCCPNTHTQTTRQ